jgi:hypothetical protein
MKNLAVAGSLVFWSVHALACPLSESLSERYGISFSGFKTAIPVATAPDTTDTAAFIRVVMQDESMALDGFRHTIVMNTKTKKAWVLRTGGFASVYEWFGPVDAPNASGRNCRAEQVQVHTLALHKQ